ncbi:hypothetical protein D5085_01275 [Ectothiorhodospiraceae bacterium BW-2]|nr:hypothetical protein D5085_01275 [Ectothiorhodospiraceae bacterium BW-2]
MQQMRVIKSGAEHEQALNRLMTLMQLDPVENSPQADELELLALLIEHYEQQQYPVDPPDPIDAIRFRMDQMEMSQRELIPYIGSASKVSDVLNRKRPLSISMIRRLTQGLGISAAIQSHRQTSITT